MRPTLRAVAGAAGAAAALLLAASAAGSPAPAAITDPNSPRSQTKPADPNALAERTMSFTYETSYAQIPKYLQSIDVWIPLPWQDDNQEVTDMVITAPGSGTPSEEPVYANRVFHVHSGPRGGVAMNLTVRCVITRREVRFDDLAKKVAVPPTPPEDLERYLKDDRLGAADAETKALATRITRGKTTALDKARAVFDWVAENLEIGTSGGTSGQGDVPQAISAKGGSPIDVAAVFTALARAAGVPARMVFGFEAPPKSIFAHITAPHAWAEFWLDGRGWIPVEPVAAVRDPSRRDMSFGRLDPHRIQISVGRDVVLAPPQKSDPLNYWLYPYAEGDGEPMGDSIYRFTYGPPPEPAPPKEPSKERGKDGAASPASTGGTR